MLFRCFPAEWPGGDSAAGAHFVVFGTYGSIRKLFRCIDPCHKCFGNMYVENDRGKNDTHVRIDENIEKPTESQLEHARKEGIAKVGDGGSKIAEAVKHVGDGGSTIAKAEKHFRK